jgi:hydroxymethylpyrimidine pyrophosphatase-like HAD family hydrolase
MLKKVVIYDMDGCLVNSLHRYRSVNGKIDLQYWLDNEHKAYQDSLLPLVEKYQAELLDPECYVIIATARVMNTPDQQFLINILGVPDKLISRNGRDDHRKGADLKIAGLRFLNQLKQFKDLDKHFFEDNAEYLKPVCDFLQCKGTYIPSKQGH